MKVKYLLPLMLVIAWPAKAGDAAKIGGGIAIGTLVGAACTYYFMSESPLEQKITTVKELTRLSSAILDNQAKTLEIVYAQCEKNAPNATVEECKKNARDAIYGMDHPVIQQLLKMRRDQLNAL